jgi:mannosyl-oligosaccharide alpha-1,2-mannosidase
MEFTRLTQLTGDPKYYDAVQRVMNELEIGQDKTRMPGLWPTWIDTDQMRFDDSEFTIGGCADSAYEYLPKAHILLGAQTDKYRRMYEKAIATFNENLVFRAMTKNENQHVLFTANVVAMRGDSKTFQYTPDHLKCFMGGTVAIGAKVFNRPEDMDIARGLTDGCVWAYDVMPTGIMPEVFKVSPCKHADKCPWDEEQWMSDVMSRPIDTEEIREKAEDRIKAKGLPPGVTDVKDAAYKLRCDSLSRLMRFGPLTYCRTDPKPSSPCSSCIGSLEIKLSKTPRGACLRTSIKRPGLSTDILPSTTCVMKGQNTTTRWRASGLRRL